MSWSLKVLAIDEIVKNIRQKVEDIRHILVWLRTSHMRRFDVLDNS
jgi:hypothetical protein